MTAEGAEPLGAGSQPPTAPATPFQISVSDAQLDDLRDRLRRTRWPEAETVSDWSQGVPLAYLRDLCECWAREYDWRATEARLNALPQFQVGIDGLAIHAIHVRSPHSDALPLLLTHGWPGSVIEFEKAIGPLTDPTAHGGDPADAFHVVCPSLPGYGFSDKPTHPGWGIERIAGVWLTLMDGLGYGQADGYERFGAHGGDWGASVTTELALRAPARVAGIHVTPPIVAPDPATFDDLTDAERTMLAGLDYAGEWESGYSTQQMTRPQTVGYGLVDSPVALCAWIVEKFRAWSDCDGHPENAFGRDKLLDNVMLYWLTGTGASSARLYWESLRRVNELLNTPGLDTVDVPTGCSIFPKEFIRPSRRWAAKRYIDIRYWNELAKGGHFSAFEQPELFVDEIRSFFRLVR